MQGVTLDTIGGGALAELFAAELTRVLANIADPNTDPEQKRAIGITVSFAPNRDRDVADVTLADDGVTQTVTAKAGVVLANEVAVPNPVVLTPYRTFREVLQPSSPFALRVTGATSGALTVGLFEADGGAWRITAVERVRDWFAHELADSAVAVLA